jgi:ABC-type uncharacterized transport system permease subunit
MTSSADSYPSFSEKQGKKKSHIHSSSARLLAIHEHSFCHQVLSKKMYNLNFLYALECVCIAWGVYVCLFDKGFDFFIFS